MMQLIHFLLQQLVKCTVSEVHAATSSRIKEARMSSAFGRQIIVAAAMLLAVVAIYHYFIKDQSHISDAMLTVECKNLLQSTYGDHLISLKGSSQAVPALRGIDITCVTGKPCEYADDVDFRIIVITYNRAVSLLKLLRSLDDLELDGDRAALEIWIDVNDKGQSHDETVKAARSFQWKKGPTRVHIQTSHAGIMGQWIDTWRPRPESKELGIILEDDISVSPMAYRWLKAVHKAMANRTDFVGASLTSDQMSVHSSNPKGPLAAPKN
jgi:hypothetical protein